VSANPGNLRRQLFLVSHGIKWNIGNSRESGGSHIKDPSSIGPPFER
jgi:hypothetical protein